MFPVAVIPSGEVAEPSPVPSGSNCGSAPSLTRIERPPTRFGGMEKEPGGVAAAPLYRTGYNVMSELRYVFLYLCHRGPPFPLSSAAWRFVRACLRA